MRAQLFPVGFRREGGTLVQSFDVVFFGTATEIDGGSSQAVVTVARTPDQTITQFEAVITDAVLAVATDRDYVLHPSRIDIPKLVKGG